MRIACRSVLMVLFWCLCSASISAFPGDQIKQQTIINLQETVPTIIKDHRVAGVGIGIVRNNKLVWTGYFGERSHNSPANADTMFNLGSMAKTVTAETVLRLVERGDVSLDESISDFYVHPDLEDDLRHRLLTPRILLSHQAGLLNWPHNYDDGRLAFITEPGKAFTYSGAGYEILANFLEKKLARPFEALVKDLVLDPLGMKGVSISRQAWMENRVAHPFDKDGVWHAPFSYPGTSYTKRRGVWDAADDLFITVEDFAKFFTNVIDGRALGSELRKERFRVHRFAKGTRYWNCWIEDQARCPKGYGYGLGWTVFPFDDQTIIQHGGNDYGEHAMVYYDKAEENGAFIFVVGGNGWFASLAIMGLIDPDQPLIPFYQGLVNQYLKSNQEGGQ